MAAGDDSPGEGIYEELLTPRLVAELASVGKGFELEKAGLDAAEAADRLALHLAELVDRTIRQLPDSTRVNAGSDIVRRVGVHLADIADAPELKQDVITEPPSVLRAIKGRNPDGSPRNPTRPLTPLLDTTLLTNPRGEPALSKQLLSEIPSAGSIDAIIAFIRYSGIRPMLDALRRHCAEGRQLRVLTTTYTGSTEQRALDELLNLGAQIRVSYDTSSTRLHAKAWLFRRGFGNSTAFIGSSNLTHSAQVAGLEWNVRASGKRNPGVIDKVGAVFESYWQSGDFVDYEPASFRAATAQGQRTTGTDLPPFELRAEPFQSRLLEQIELARERGMHRNLLVSATGTGKTVMAALDYARLRRTLPRARLLFIAHREEILQQSMATFRHALREQSFGELWVGGRRPTQFEHVFASIQSVTASGVDDIDPRHFDVVIVDEFHHAAATSYERLLTQIQPIELLGLTATPERADGMPILQWFGDRIAAELRLWDAIDQQRLVPFLYYGISDGTDLTDVPWVRGRGYQITELSNVYTSNDAWARTVIHQTKKYVYDSQHMRALGFCVSIDHAKFMAHHFNTAGIAATAVHSGTPPAERKQALADLQNGNLQAIFSVDLFNEGVDVPAVDTILMTRPTESATVFLQQLGRGLRKSPETDKSACTVLDFVGKQRREFRFDQRYVALLGGSRKDVERAIKDDFPYLPAGCHMELDTGSREIVLRSIREALPTTWAARVRELRSIVSAGYLPTLRNYLDQTGLDLADVYANDHCWSDLCQAAGVDVSTAGPEEAALRKALGRMLHVDDSLRLDAYARFSRMVGAPDVDQLDSIDRALLRMLAISLTGTVLAKPQWKGSDLQTAADLMFQHPQVLAEIGALTDILRDRIDHVQTNLAGRQSIPLRLHAQYTRQEILAAMHQGETTAATPEWREGVKWMPDQNADALAFTFVKSADHFSPTTRYRDYAISPSLIHWESQSTTSADSPTGVRYRNHVERDSQVFLFARLSNATRAFWFLGPASYVKHQGDQPMGVTWRLETPLPGDLFAEFAAAA